MRRLRTATYTDLLTLHELLTGDLLNVAKTITGYAHHSSVDVPSCCATRATILQSAH